MEVSPDFPPLVHEEAHAPVDHRDLSVTNHQRRAALSRDFELRVFQTAERRRHDEPPDTDTAFGRQFFPTQVLGGFALESVAAAHLTVTTPESSATLTKPRLITRPLGSTRSGCEAAAAERTQTLLAGGAAPAGEPPLASWRRTRCRACLTSALTSSKTRTRKLMPVLEGVSSETFEKWATFRVGGAVLGDVAWALPPLRDCSLRDAAEETPCAARPEANAPCEGLLAWTWW